MITHIPKVLYQNKITEVLDDIKYNYGILTRKGYIYGLIAIDQDAKNVLMKMETSVLRTFFIKIL